MVDLNPEKDFSVIFKKCFLSASKWVLFEISKIMESKSELPLF